MYLAMLMKLTTIFCLGPIKRHYQINLSSHWLA